MFDPVTLVAIAAGLVAAFSGGRFFERWNAPEAAKARLVAVAKAAVQKAEAIKPDAAAQAARDAHAAQVVADLKAEVAKLA